MATKEVGMGNAPARGSLQARPLCWPGPRQPPGEEHALLTKRNSLGLSFGKVSSFSSLMVKYFTFIFILLYVASCLTKLLYFLPYL